MSPSSKRPAPSATPPASRDAASGVTAPGTEVVRLTRFELDVMEELWKLGRASVRELLEQLPSRRRPAYTTVQTIVRRLEEKGAVQRVKKIGNAHIFEPTVERQHAYRRLVSDFLDLFGGSAKPLVAHLARSGQLSLDDLREAEEILAEDGDSWDQENAVTR